MAQIDSLRSLIKTDTGAWEVVIGLEIHAQIMSETKLFSRAETSFAAEPNTHVTPIDAGFPGMLPLLNSYCVHQAIKTGLGLNAQINLFSRFDRKNYFYPDLPNGYQITQLYHPIVGEGHLDIPVAGNENSIRVGIERIHLEQDAGKSIHDLSPDSSFIDLNRAGTALMEIVTKPDLRSADEVMAFMKKIRLILRYLGTSDGNMDEGSLRADVNVSVRRPGEPLGRRVEIKNANSIKFIGQAIHFEINRQIAALESGAEITQETRLYDPQKGETRPMRSKEDAQDYRYHPDPDLLPIQLENDYIDTIRQSMPELPDPKRSRFIKEYGLSAYDAEVMVSEIETPDIYERAVQGLSSWKDGQHDTLQSKLLANWFLGDLFGQLKKESLKITDIPFEIEHLSALVNLISDDTISGKIAKDVFQEIWKTNKSPKVIVEEKGLKQVTDVSMIEDEVEKVIEAHPQMVQDYLGGKDKIIGFLIGQIMKATKGKINPGALNQIMVKKLSSMRGGK